MPTAMASWSRRSVGAWPLHFASFARSGALDLPGRMGLDVVLVVRAEGREEREA